MNKKFEMWMHHQICIIHLWENFKSIFFKKKKEKVSFSTSNSVKGVRKLILFSLIPHQKKKSDLFFKILHYHYYYYFT
jgi:hypothetical protein